MSIPINQILNGDIIEKLKELPDNSIDTIITSPPYWGLRDYGIEGQIGLDGYVRIIESGKQETHDGRKIKGYKFNAIDAATGQLKWSFETDNKIRSDATVANGAVYVPCTDTLYALDAKTGNELWQIDIFAWLLPFVCRLL